MNRDPLDRAIAWVFLCFAVVGTSLLLLLLVYVLLVLLHGFGVPIPVPAFPR